ncbi:LOW QUALITY PROTEIN: olfactory receptor 1030-like [Ornithorhynchus anatinus]|uniref:LOW QUALITY PROTEIN: olfactory receptor 1030-like n=1 Tax=Ornithorhynchus anatinus TaxID=9258 RepID=UPI000223FFED|nr:LOW QUALITY PROTEIN: olfactory receptor 1030-like [Ornithorhynchus anatinus]
MARGNYSTVTEFVLMGFSDHPELQLPLFLVFLVIFLATLLGNLMMVLLIQVSSPLHTPMYYFLSHLSFIDLCYSSSIAPKMLQDFLRKKKTISFAGCFAQMYFSSAFSTTECFLLATMAYDRYMAICKPLIYTTIMTKRVCRELMIGVYTYGFLYSVIQTVLTFQLSFCDSNIIHHFYCADPPLLALSCSDILAKRNQLLIFSALNLSSSLLTILVSYVCILVSILKIPSSEGRCKAFSTCASHLTVVTIFYSTLFFMYLRQPRIGDSWNYNKEVSVFYSLVIPMLNPLIYSLRNAEVKATLTKLLDGKALR